MLRNHKVGEKPLNQAGALSGTRGVNSIPDQEGLVKALRRKDPLAFEYLIQRYGPLLTAVASRIVGDDDAQDVLQDTWLTVYRSIHGFSEQAALATWLHRIAVNMSLTHLRRKSRSHGKPLDRTRSYFAREAKLPAETSEETISPEDALLGREARHLVRQEINRLPEIYRSVLIASEMRKLSDPETAEVLNVSVSAVKTRHSRARRYLRKRLERDFAERGRRVPLEANIAA